MSDRLSKKEKGFVKSIVAGDNGTQAALKNYDAKNENIAANIASTNLRKPKIIKAIKSIADKLPDADLLKVHKEGLKAIKTEGTVVTPDYAVRHKYLDSAYKIKGTYAPEKSINLNLTQEIKSPEAIAKAKAFDEWYEKQS